MSKRARTSYSSASEGAVVKKEDAEMDGPTLEDVIKGTQRTKGDMSTVFEMLRDHSSKWLPGAGIDDPARQRLQNVAVVTRVEEESFLRTRVAASGERDCASGDACEGTKIVGPPGGGVILVEHWLQGTPRPAAAGFCIMCKRAQITYFYFNSVAEGDDMGQTFHEHANIIEQEGEYTVDQCVIAGTREVHGALLPCAIHCRAWYAYQGTKDGVHWFTQPGYDYPQVFRQLAGAPCPF